MIIEKRADVKRKPVSLTIPFSPFPFFPYKVRWREACLIRNNDSANLLHQAARFAGAPASRRNDGQADLQINGSRLEAPAFARQHPVGT
jgi:hypothetical protein